jgi:hypothetical protein
MPILYWEIWGDMARNGEIWGAMGSHVAVTCTMPILYWGYSRRSRVSSAVHLGDAGRCREM